MEHHLITNDGVTIAKEIELEDPFENMGSTTCKRSINKTNDVAGDGTTTATVLAQKYDKRRSKKMLQQVETLNGNKRGNG